MILGASCTALMLAVATLAVHDWFAARAELELSLRTSARTVGANVRSSLEFQDQDFANEALRAFEPQENVLWAEIRDRTGAVFATWKRDAKATDAAAGENPSGAIRVDVP